MAGKELDQRFVRLSAVGRRRESHFDPFTVLAREFRADGPGLDMKVEGQTVAAATRR